MLKTASWATMLLVAAAGCGVAPTARAADCLQQVDGITVQYDLPASESIAGTQTSRYPHQAQPVEGPARRTPAGRPGANLTESMGQSSPEAAQGTVEHPRNPMQPSNRGLTNAQRSKLMSVLHAARAADALADEDKCLDLLRQAQSITGKHG